MMTAMTENYMGLIPPKLATSFDISFTLCWLLVDSLGPADSTFGSWIANLEFDSLLVLPVGSYIMQDNFFLS